MSGFGPLAEADSDDGADPRTAADLSVDDREYFGADLGAVDAFGSLPIDPDDPRQPVRHSYVYQAVFEIGDTEDGQSEFGGIQIRARVYTFRQSLSTELQAWLEESAHRSAHMFNSRIQADYVNRAGIRGGGGDGFLDGFNAHESYKNHEHEPVERVETQPGVIDWSVEIYEDDSFDYAELSGIAQGVSSPWRVGVDRVESEPPVDVPPVKFDVTYNESRGDYQIAAPGNTAARDRYKSGAGNGKIVTVDGLPIGRLDTTRGRVWLSKEYAGGDPETTSGGFGTYYSRAGILANSPNATAQAIRDGGNLYLVGETEDTVELSTYGNLPDGYETVDPNEMPRDVEARAGSPGRDLTTLYLADPTDDGLRSECRRDDTIIRFMGLSTPRYDHVLSRRQRWEAEVSKR